MSFLLAFVFTDYYTAIPFPVKGRAPRAARIAAGEENIGKNKKIRPRPVDTGGRI